MRVAVTGASGLVGAHVVAELLTAGHTTLRVRREAGGDLVPPRDRGRADALVHLGFPTDAAERRSRPTATLRSVARGAADAVAIAELLGAKSLVLASTGKVYGCPDVQTIADATPARPTTQLGELKLLAEGIFAAAAHGAGFGVTTLRIFNAYGPGQREPFLVPTVLAGIERGTLSLGELDHARDWIHVADVARAFVSALASAAAPGQVRTWNVASGEAHSVRDILARLRLAGARVPEPLVDASKLRSREAAFERAACEGLRALGWSPCISLDAGLAELLVRRGLVTTAVEPGAAAASSSPECSP